MSLHSAAPRLPLLVMVASLACSRNPVGPGDLPRTELVGALIGALQQQGATVMLMEQLSRVSHCLSVGAVRLAVDGENVYVFEYESAEAANTDAGTVSPAGDTINGAGRACSILWIGPPRFYKEDRLIVLYVGTNQDLIRKLDGLLGRPFAGR
jgi:hypothetical protein